MRRGESLPPGRPAADRRDLLRARRPPSGVGRARALGRERHRRLRDRGGDAGRRGPDDHARRPAAEEPRARVLRARAAARRGQAARSRCPIRGTTRCWPRASRRGAFARCRTAASRSTARDRAAVVRDTSTSPVVAMLREARPDRRATPRPRPTCGRQPSATGCCARTAGTRTSCSGSWPASGACARRSLARPPSSADTAPRRGGSRSAA